ncbi:coiled-coil domain-containing protein 3a isoform X1 [Alosa sapidissima]|uniref:coiled-coil domain-containing protein 3a isoform X1 n=1 Tax=Alosa sapidissima TaxID=34773 RepID=UPI001C0A11E0|nr:coiled-coil domain-containing protein 3a isoform X1 [Alosa sapidissima]XP_041934759.1 coiled-coil domain-containing protein 3a isoform X1 [Alosa sapidissima]
MLRAHLMALGLLLCPLGLALGCQLPTEWRPLSEGCRAELAEIIVYAKVLAIHEEPYASSLFNYLPYQFEEERVGEGLLYAAEVEMLCDQAWGSMLEVPAGSRLNLTGLGYFSCQSHTVMENESYIFFLRMDENYNLLPHGVNFQDAIFPDTPENRRTFSSLFQFSNCTHGHPMQSYSPAWESQEDSRLLCSSVQQVLFEEEERVRVLTERTAELERRNRQLKERVRKLKRSMRRARKTARQAERERHELRERLSAAERRAGHHLNAISPHHAAPQKPKQTTPRRSSYIQGL